MHTLITHLQNKGVKTYIVTASVKWAVEGAAKLYNIPEDQVVGVTTKVVDGLITDQQDGPVTWKQGKVEGLMQATKRQAPFFAAGNSSGDIYLLEAATRIIAWPFRLLSEKDHRIFESEVELAKLWKAKIGGCMTTA
ncbi:MAG: haloacid dehalogenase-like hydrolase [Bdellovibrionales bacterium]